MDIPPKQARLITSSPLIPTYDKMNKIYDDVLNSIKFELQNSFSSQETALKESLGSRKVEHNTRKTLI